MIIENAYYAETIQPQVRRIKSLLGSDPDDLPILHREDILARRGDFKNLHDSSVSKEFDRLLMELLSEHEFIICTVVLDKVKHLENYGSAAYHPYNYCLNVILEKYTHWLHTAGARGDVMAEARGGAEDRKLEKEYQKFYKLGTQFRSPEYVQSVLTAGDIKMRRKSARIEGLEIADLLTLATKIDVLHTYGVIPTLHTNFQTKIIRSIQPKYYRNNGIMKGYGKKLL